MNCLHPRWLRRASAPSYLARLTTAKRLMRKRTHQIHVSGWNTQRRGHQRETVAVSQKTLHVLHGWHLRAEERKARKICRWKKWLLISSMGVCSSPISLAKGSGSTLVWWSVFHNLRDGWGHMTHDQQDSTCTEVFVQAVRVSNRSFAYKRSTHTSLTGTGKRYLLREEYTHTPWQAAATCFLYFGVLPRKSVSATLPKIFVIIGEHARFALNRSVVIVLPSKTLQPTCGFKWSYFATILVFAPISNGHEDHDDTIAKWNLLVCHVKLNSTFCTASSIPDDNKIRFWKNWPGLSQVLVANFQQRQHVCAAEFEFLSTFTLILKTTNNRYFLRPFGD